MSAKRISQSELESYLWGAATLLRGTIDAGEYKSEPPRVLRGLHALRGWSHDRAAEAGEVSG